jgi:diadenosine tetraphosphate (Ap4A) HIT family hydrolase
MEDLNKKMDNNSYSDSHLICTVPSGFVLLSNMQFLRGYCILRANPIVDSINSLNIQDQIGFCKDMIMIGDSIMEVTGAYRINYALLGNSDPVLHAHIVPRYLSEPDNLREGLPWSYPNMDDEEFIFNQDRDKDLIQKLKTSIQRRINSGVIS